MRFRGKVIIGLLLTLVLGIVSRRFPVGWYPYDKSLGDVLYAVAVYLGLALLLPRRSPLGIGLLAPALCLAIELFKFTGIPTQYGRTPLRWLLGTTFSWHNLGCAGLSARGANNDLCRREGHAKLA